MYSIMYLPLPLFSSLPPSLLPSLPLYPSPPPSLFLSPSPSTSAYAMHTWLKPHPPAPRGQRSRLWPLWVSWVTPSHSLSLWTAGIAQWPSGTALGEEGLLCEWRESGGGSLWLKRVSDPSVPTSWPWWVPGGRGEGKREGGRERDKENVDKKQMKTNFFCNSILITRKVNSTHLQTHVHVYTCISMYVLYVRMYCT